MSSNARRAARGPHFANDAAGRLQTCMQNTLHRQVSLTEVTEVFVFNEWARMTPPQASSRVPSAPLRSRVVMALSRICLMGMPLNDSKWDLSTMGMKSCAVSAVRPLLRTSTCLTNRFRAAEHQPTSSTARYHQCQSRKPTCTQLQRPATHASHKTRPQTSR